jgi:hypothetical protein
MTVDRLKELPGVSGTEFSDFRCFGAGCTVTATSKDAHSAEAAAAALVHSEHFMLWPGPRFRSGPIDTPSGRVQTIIVFYKPPESTSSVTH